MCKKNGRLKTLGNEMRVPEPILRMGTELSRYYASGRMGQREACYFCPGSLSFPQSFLIKLRKVRCFVDGRDLAFGFVAHDSGDVGPGLQICGGEKANETAQAWGSFRKST
jgi:hypothetical protein